MHEKTLLPPALILALSHHMQDNDWRETEAQNGWGIGDSIRLDLGLLPHPCILVPVPLSSGAPRVHAIFLFPWKDPGAHPGVPIPWRDCACPTVCWSSPYPVLLCLGYSSALCWYPLSPNAHLAVPEALSCRSLSLRLLRTLSCCLPTTGVAKVLSCYLLSPAALCPLERCCYPSHCPQPLRHPSCPLLPSHSPQLEVGCLGGVTEVNAHHHAGCVPGCQAL